MFNFNSTLLKTSVFTSQEKPTSVHQLLNHNYSQKAQAASPLKRFLNVCVCPRDSVCVPPFWEGYWQAWSSTPPTHTHTPSCNRRYLPKVIKTRSGTASHSHQLFCVFPQNTTQHFVSFYKFIFPKNIQAVRHSSLSSMPQVQPSRTAQSCKKLKCHCQGQRGGVQSGSTNATSSYRVQNWTNPFVWKKEKKRASCCFIMRNNLATRTELL